jgi:hypothetical protein
MCRRLGRERNGERVTLVFVPIDGVVYIFGVFESVARHFGDGKNT